jgi:hypothetical protein
MTMVRAPRVPDWNGGADMVRLRRRIGVLQARNRALDWDNAAVPLEMMPVRRSTAEEDVVLQHAGSSENP